MGYLSEECVPILSDLQSQFSPPRELEADGYGTVRCAWWLLSSPTAKLGLGLQGEQNTKQTWNVHRPHVKVSEHFSEELSDPQVSLSHGDNWLLCYSIDETQNCSLRIS